MEEEDIVQPEAVWLVENADVVTQIKEEPDEDLSFLEPKVEMMVEDSLKNESDSSLHFDSSTYQTGTNVKEENVEEVKSEVDVEEHSILNFTEEKPFKCQVCNKSFAESGTLSDHMRHHTGKKPYVCEYCGKGFSHHSKILVHRRSHTGKEVQKRWRLQRDCFSRELSLQEKPPSGSGANKRRKHTYFEQLQLLSSTMGQQNASSSFTPLETGTDISDDMRAEHSQKQRNNFEKVMIKLLEKYSSKDDEEDDDDKHFLLSLLPILKKFDEDNKLLVRVEIINAIRKVQSANHK